MRFRGNRYQTVWKPETDSRRFRAVVALSEVVVLRHPGLLGNDAAERSHEPDHAGGQKRRAGAVLDRLPARNDDVPAFVHQPAQQIEPALHARVEIVVWYELLFAIQPRESVEIEGSPRLRPRTAGRNAGLDAAAPGFGQFQAALGIHGPFDKAHATQSAKL